MLCLGQKRVLPFYWSQLVAMTCMSHHSLQTSACKGLSQTAVVNVWSHLILTQLKCGTLKEVILWVCYVLGGSFISSRDCHFYLVIRAMWRSNRSELFWQRQHLSPCSFILSYLKTLNFDPASKHCKIQMDKVISSKEIVVLCWWGMETNIWFNHN